MSLLGSENIKLLQKLFKSADDSSDEETTPGEATPQFGPIGPGDIGETVVQAKTARSKDPGEHVKPCSYAPLENVTETSSTDQPKTLEEWESQQQQQDQTLFESRRRPEYRISYRQTVATEDIYLQMNGKTPGTASCENMIVDIFFPEEDSPLFGVQQIDLAVKEQCVGVQTPKYCLDLTLPHKIDPDKGGAVWDSEKKTLSLTLRMVRELDFVNF